MGEFIEAVKAYIKVDGDDPVLEAIVAAAIDECEKETGKKFDPSLPAYAHAVKMIVADWYDIRGTATTYSLKDVPASIHVQKILNKIAFDSSYEVI